MAGDYPALHRLEGGLQPLTGNLSGPFYMTVQGTVNTVGGGTGGTSSTDESAFTAGGTSLTPMGALSMSLGAQAAASMGYDRIGAPKMSGQRILFTSIATPSGGDAMDNTNAALRVNVVAGGAGGGVANLTVRGTANTDFHVGVASLGAAPQADGAMYLPILGSVNIGGAIGIFGSIAAGSLNVLAGQAGAPWTVTGSQGVTQLGAPWSAVGSMGVTPLATFTVNLGVATGTVNIGNIPAVSVGSIASGSMNVLAGQAGAPWSVVGSVNTTPQGVQVVDTRGSLVPTQWIISGTASGQFVVSGSAPASQRDWLSSFHVVATGTIDFTWMSPSGVAISGSMRLLPGAGFAMAGAFPNGPVLYGSQQSAIYINSQGTGNIGGFAAGWVA